MEIIKKLRLNVGGDEKVIIFGIPNEEKEVEEMHRLRYEIYSKKKYIEEGNHDIEQDEYDDNNRSTYFIAKLDDCIIGTVRLISDNILPTEKAFKFDEPESLADLDRNQRGELGRLIVRAYNVEKQVYLPRNLVLLFLIYCLVLHGKKHNILGGYSFVKESLLCKLKKLNIPIGEISEYEQTYEEGGVLYKYFTQQDDKVVPIYFVTQVIEDYICKVIHKTSMFEEINDDTFRLKDNLYNKFLRKTKIL